MLNKGASKLLWALCWFSWKKTALQHLPTTVVASGRSIWTRVFCEIIWGSSFFLFTTSVLLKVGLIYFRSMKVLEKAKLWVLIIAPCLDFSRELTVCFILYVVFSVKANIKLIRNKISDRKKQLLSCREISKHQLMYVEIHMICRSCCMPLLAPSCSA